MRYDRAYPSRTAPPKGRVELVPPRKRFHMVSAKDEACASEVKPAAPVAPPRLMVTIFPLDWHVSIAEAKKEQSGNCVPAKTVLSLTLQV